MADKVVVVRLRAAVGEYTSGMARAGGQAITFAGQVGVAAKANDAAMIKAKKAMAGIATGAAVAGKLMLAGVGAAMVVSAKAAIDFESSLAGVAKTVDGTTAQIDAIGQSMRRLSTVIPVNVNELNNIAELGGQLGVEIPNLVEFTEVIAALGVTTNLSTEDAAKGLARLANVIGLSQTDFDMLGSIIVDLGNNFATTEAEILTFALRIAPAAQTVGASADEVLGLAAALSSMGIPAERGGTAVQTMMTIIASASRSGGTELAAMAEITNMTTEAFADMAKAAPTDTLVELAIGLGRANDRGEDVFGMMRSVGIMGRRAQAVLLAMSNNTELLGEALELAGEAGEENNALFEEAARRYGTTSSEIKIMANSFTDLRIELGQGLLPLIGESVRTLSALFQIMRNNADTVKTFGAGLAIVGGLLLLAGIVKGIVALRAFWVTTRLAIGAVTGLSRAMAIMHFSMGPIGIAIGLITVAVIALGIAGIAAARHLAAVKESAQEYQAAVEEGVAPTEALIDTLDTEEIEGSAAGLDLIGASIEDIAAAAQNPRLLQEFIDELDRASEFTDLEFAAGLVVPPGTPDNIITNPRIEGLQQNAKDLEAARKIAVQLGETYEENVSQRAVQMALDVKSAGVEIKGNMVDLILIATRFARNNPLGEGSDFIRFMTGEMPQDGWLGAIMGARQVEKAALIAEQSWDGFLVTTEGGGERLIDFYEDTGKLADDWAESLTDSFDEVAEALLSGMPAWDEYETIAIESLDAVFAAQTAWLTDLGDWAGVQESLMGIASQATLDWLDAQDAPTLGALARRWKDNLGLMEVDIEGLNLTLDTAATHVETVLTSRLPLILGKAVPEIHDKMNLLVAELELPPGDAEKLTDAYHAGLVSFMAALPASLSAEVKTMIASLLGLTPDLEQIVKDSGFTAGTTWVQSLAAAIAAGKIILPEAMTSGVVDPIIKTWQTGMESSSPSKVAIRMGEDFTQSIAMGMKTGIQTDMFQQVTPAFQAMMDANGSSTTTTNSRGGDLHIHHPHHPTDDLTKDLQRSSNLSGIQRLAEVGTINDT